MRQLPTPREEHAERWRELIGVLAAQENELAQAYLAEIDDGYRFYEGLVGRDDLVDSARMAFRYILGILAEQQLDAEVAAFPAEVGRRRAQQGVALENLLSAVRRDVTVAWSYLIGIATTADLPVLAVYAETLWRTVDAFAERIHSSYLRERIAMARSDVLRQHEFLERLLDPAGLGANQASIIGEGLGLAPDGRFRVAVATARCDLDPFAAVLRTRKVPVYLHETGGRATVVWSDDSDNAAGPDVVPAALRNVPCAVSPTTRSLCDVGPVAAIAAELLNARPDITTGAVTLVDMWPRLVHRQASATAVRATALVVDALAGYSDTEQHVLVETVRTFVRTGDVSVTADTLYCHRNTVLNRLRRFRMLTGLDLRVPEHAALVAVALAGWD